MVDRGEPGGVPYYPYVESWTDERLDDLAASLRPLPAQMASVEERLEQLSDRMDRQTEEIRLWRSEMRQDMSALQRQFAQMGWGLSFALIGAVVALIISVA
jgi:tetrahydromethanopterin S-methyltransferase subunit B